MPPSPWPWHAPHMCLWTHTQHPAVDPLRPPFGLSLVSSLLSAPLNFCVLVPCSSSVSLTREFSRPCWVSAPCAPAWTASQGAGRAAQGSPFSDPSSRTSVFCGTVPFVSKALFHVCILPVFGCFRCEVKSNPPYSVLCTHWSFISTSSPRV